MGYFGPLLRNGLVLSQKLSKVDCSIHLNAWAGLGEAVSVWTAYPGGGCPALKMSCSLS